MGSHLNMFLYTGELALTFWYLRNSKTIPIYKYGIYASIVIDGLGSLFVIANVYVVRVGPCIHFLHLADVRPIVYDSAEWCVTPRTSLQRRSEMKICRRNRNQTRVANSGCHCSQLRVCDNRAMFLHVPVLDDVSAVYGSILSLS